MEKTCNQQMKDSEVVHNYLETQASRCFSLLYSRYAPKIFSKCITMLRDEALAQDATQEIFMKIFLNLAKFGEKAKFSTWVYSITYNYCIDYIRRKNHCALILPTSRSGSYLPWESSGMDLTGRGSTPHRKA